MGENASTILYKYAHQYESSSFYFMNEYNTIEESADPTSSLANYIQKLREIQSYPDTPIWLTEIDVKSGFNQAQTAQHLEQILREGHGHPNVNGIMLWGGWSLHATTDANGFLETSLFWNADYHIKIIHPAILNSSSSIHSFKVPEASTADFDSSGQSTIMFLHVFA
ncbi:hypothetical protein Q3G72_020458 [Acer saccharum]|nr:hypothetical protein Q3G72_020458 [Acer saccharum]